MINTYGVHNPQYPSHHHQIQMKRNQHIHRQTYSRQASRSDRAENLPSGYLIGTARGFHQGFSPAHTLLPTFTLPQAADRVQYIGLRTAELRQEGRSRNRAGLLHTSHTTTELHSTYYTLGSKVKCEAEDCRVG